MQIALESHGQCHSWNRQHTWAEWSRSRRLWTTFSEKASILSRKAMCGVAWWVFFPLYIFILTSRHIDFVSPQELAKLTCNGGRRGLQNFQEIRCPWPQHSREDCGACRTPPRPAGMGGIWRRKVWLKVCLSISCYTIPAYSILKVKHMPSLSSTVMTSQLNEDNKPVDAVIFSLQAVSTISTSYLHHLTFLLSG